MASNWETLVATKQKEAAGKIPNDWRLPSSILSTISEKANISVLDVPRTCGLLTDRELSLTEDYDATGLIELMIIGKATSYEVTLAFCKRTAIAQQLVNCCTEIFFDEALARAKQCDEYLAKEGKPMGPVHGLPISLKDSFNVKGVKTTIGYVSFINHPAATANSTVVEILFRAGAVFYVKTNLPQTMMTADSHNNVFGRTLNPNKLSLTAGGSTGGEAALIKLRGSVLGLKTDIAGSARIPAICNGISSLKPTAGRIPFGNKVAPGRIGSPSLILPVIGPGAHSVRDLELLMKTVIDAQPWETDFLCIDIPWRSVPAVSRPLTFGLVGGHPKRPLHPTIARVLHTAATALKEAGHSIILLDEKIPDLWETGLLSFKNYMLDPKNTAASYVNASGEPWIPSIPTALMKDLEGWQPSLDELFDMNIERAKVLKVYHDLFVDNKLDAIIMPGYQATAVPHDTFGIPLYTMIQNLINYPSGILPFSKASKDLDAPFIKEGTTYEPLYNPEAVEGAPGTLQVMGRPMKDEELLKVMAVVEDILRKAT